MVWRDRARDVERLTFSRQIKPGRFVDRRCAGAGTVTRVRLYFQPMDHYFTIPRVTFQQRESVMECCQ
ncbi:hypothetical protein EVAR_11538_1 [Eumeta japonica]|uniref:Uncharacterized protein n=1 Tax=Eumeta variegata TaxID=151549 RepID=A0A4C1TYS8_EUMVA|nr:hypothetical protein EVAR_11538_1 [Eumeta japonica]